MEAKLLLAPPKAIAMLTEPIDSPRRSRVTVKIAGWILFTVWATTAAWADDSSHERKQTRDLTEMSLEELTNLEVTTVLKKPAKRLEIPAAVYVITEEEIRRSGATSIPEVLRLAPGVQVARIDSNKWGIGVRGFTSRLSRSLLLLMDGRGVYTPLFAGVYWEVQDTLLDDIDRIEVIRGPGGTLWGANAVNGVINVITKRAEETPGLLVTMGGGPIEQGFAGFRFGGRAGDSINYRLYGKAFSRDAGFHGDGRNFDDWRMGQAGFRMDWDLQKGNVFTLQGDLYRGESGQRTILTSFSPPFSTPVEKNADLSGSNVLSRWHRRASETSDLDLQVYYDHTHRREPSFRENRDTFELDFQHRFLLSPRHGLNWGFACRVTSGEFDAVPTIVFLPRRRTDNLFSSFVQDEMPFFKNKLRLLVGSKFERNDYSDFEVQPSARLLWAPTPQQVLWGAISRAVRTPSRVEHDLVLTALLDPSSPAFLRVLGDKRFVPEKLLTYELGYRTQASPQVLLDVTGFYNDHKDLLSLEPEVLFFETSPPPPHVVLPTFLRNGMDGKSYGVELAAHWRPSKWWRLDGTYSYLRLNLERQPGSLDTTTERTTEGSSPHHRVSLQSYVNLPKNLEFNLLFHFVDDLPMQRVDRYTSSDVRLSWRPIQALELAVVGQNLLDSHHPEFGGGASGTTEVKRGAYGKITWRR